MRFMYLNVAALRAAARVYLDRQNPNHKHANSGLCCRAQLAYDDAAESYGSHELSVEEFTTLQACLHEKWPHYSGSPCYPVPGHTAGDKPRGGGRIYTGLDPARLAEDAYYNLLRGAGAYGFARRDLAGFMGRELLALALWLEAGNPCPDFERRGN